MQESIAKTVLSAKAGDSKAFESLVHQFQDLVVGYAIVAMERIASQTILYIVGPRKVSISPSRVRFCTYIQLLVVF